MAYGIFLYFYLSIDATKSKRLAKYINDSSKRTANSHILVKATAGVPYFALHSNKLINAGDELRYDYGDYNGLWWRKKLVRFFCCRFVIM